MREATQPRIIEMIITPQTPNSTKAAGKGVYEFFTSPNVKLSHPERAGEARNAVPPSGGYKLDVSARG